MAWNIKIRQRARLLRYKGESFPNISRTLNISKSTLHYWLKDIPKPERYRNQMKWLESIRPLAKQAIISKRNNEIELIKQKSYEEVNKWQEVHSLEFQNAILSILYWAEGQKLPDRGAPVKFANTDPKLILLFVQLLKNCYKIDERKLKILLYVHWYHNKKAVKEYWMKLLHINEDQIYKIYTKKRSKTKKFKRNFMGICFVIYHNVDLRQSIMHKAYAIQKRIIDHK